MQLQHYPCQEFSMDSEALNTHYDYLVCIILENPEIFFLASKTHQFWWYNISSLCWVVRFALLVAVPCEPCHSAAQS